MVSQLLLVLLMLVVLLDTYASNTSWLYSLNILNLQLNLYIVALKIENSTSVAT